MGERSLCVDLNSDLNSENFEDSVKLGIYCNIFVFFLKKIEEVF